MIVIYFEDEDIMVVDKPAGLPSHKSANDDTPLPDYLGENLNPVHRLDQRVSGIILLAKNKESFAVLQSDFEHRRVKKKYRAMVSNAPTNQEDTLTHWIERDAKIKKAIVYNEEIVGRKKSVLSYKLVHSSEKYHLLEIELFTGRFHQIRAQLSTIGCPIVGDIKYGFKRSSPDGSIFLQSFYLEFKHPKNKKTMSFQLEMPELWKKYGF
jgi:23S rRNA pseudouridine1911/1915/1917 synthase